MKKRPRSSLFGPLGIWILFCLCSAGPAVGQHGALTTPAVPVNSYADSDAIFDFGAAVAMDDLGHGVAIWSQLNDSCQPLVSRTSDHGLTWSAFSGVKSNVVLDRGVRDTDPAVATDGNGTWIAVWSSTDTLGGTLDGNWDILYSRSVDGGLVWNSPQSLSATVSSFSEAPDIATDGQDNWVVFWHGDGIKYARSTDGGLTWEPESTIIGNAQHSDVNVEADGSGTWIVVWESSDDIGGIGSDRDILFSRSVDGGRTWSAPRAANNNATGASSTDRHPVIAVDNAGTWVVAWEAYNGLEGALGLDFDLLFARSTDGGVSWSDPAVLNSNAATDGFGHTDGTQTLAVDEHGNWFGAWRAFDGQGSSLQAARSSDGGATWSSVAPLGPEPGADFSPILHAGDLANWLVVWDTTHSPGGAFGGDRDIMASSFRLPFESTCGSDNDADGFGTPGDASCPLGSTPDCDDTELRVAPGALQACDGLNNDCHHPAWPGLTATNESDDDGDGLSECEGDCDDLDGLSLALPGEVTSLIASKDELGAAILDWSPPAATGGDPSVLVYDVVRSGTPFVCWGFGPQICLETDDGTDTSATDGESPPSGATFFYLVRAENGCPDTGRPGTPGSNRLRLAIDCR